MATSRVERVATLRDWIVAGLRAGESFAYAESRGSTASPSVADALAGTPVDLARAHQHGSLLPIPVADFYSVEAPAKLLALVETGGIRRLRIAADARHGLQVLDQPSYLDYERGLAHSCATGPLSALCQFDGVDVGTWLSEVSGMHVGFGPPSTLIVQSDDESVRLFGEVDVTNADRMTHALQLAAAGADGFLMVDLAGLTFLSAAGCRALIEGTDRYRARGGHVLLGGVRPPVERVLELLGFDKAPGFTMARDSS